MSRGGERCRKAALVVFVAGLAGPPALALADDNGLPPSDPNAIVSFLWENSSVTTSSLPDRYYVNGLDLGYVSPTGDLPEFISNIGRSVWGDGNQRIAVDLSQWMYTPAATHVAPPPPNDEPYAGVLTADVSLVQDTSAWRSILGLDVGVLGPDSGAEIVQNNFHDLIGQGHDAGWHYQMPNEPVLEFTSERVWRIPTGRIGSLETDILPNLTIGVGNLWIYALTGAVVRLGQGLASDYGVDRLGPGMSGGPAYTPVRPFDWYVFAGADGQAWLYNAVLAGEPFQSTPSVSEKTFVGELEAGIAFIIHGVRISYTQVFQTQTFYGEHGGLHQWGSLNAQFSF